MGRTPLRCAVCAATIVLCTMSPAHPQPQVSSAQAPTRPPSTAGLPPALDLVESTHGSGNLLPHEVFELDSSGQPTTVLVQIRNVETLFANVTPSNPVLPVAHWPSSAFLPSGDPGNHYLVVELSEAIAVPSVLDSSPAGSSSSGLIGVWIAHQGPLDAAGQPTGVQGGALTNARVVSSVSGLLPLNATNHATPQFRAMRIAVDASIDESQLTGIPVDLAQDDQVNLGVLPNFASIFGAGTPAALNGKSLVRQSNGAVVPAKSPKLLFLAVPFSREGPGVVDAIDLSTGLRVDTDPWLPGVQSIPVPGVRGLADYWRP